jgi:hypothetical protein
MHVGTFAEAKAQAAAERKWLLVNIQCETEFASHRLNRDTWHNETVKPSLRPWTRLPTCIDVAEGVFRTASVRVRAQAACVLFFDRIFLNLQV